MIPLGQENASSMNLLANQPSFLPMHVGTQNGTFVTFERLLGVRLVIQIDHRHLEVSRRIRATMVNGFREKIDFSSAHHVGR